jgi:hypothetical protein
MVKRTTLVAVVLSVAVPLLGVVATAGPAAAKKLKPTGSITCALSQTISFNPELTANVAGTSGYAYDRVTISPAQLSNCQSETPPAGVVPQLGVGTKPMVVKWKGTKVGMSKSAGSCITFNTFVWPRLKPRYNWTATGLRLKGSKVLTTGYRQSTADGGAEQGIIYTGVATGSYAGPVTVADFFTVASSDLLTSCAANGPPVPSLTIDPTTSYVSIG